MVTAKERVRELLASGLYDQNKIFNLLYPTWTKHYSVLRDIISEEKNDDATRFG